MLKVHEIYTSKIRKCRYHTVTIVGFDCTLSTLQWLTVYIKWLLEIHLNYTEKTNKVNDCNFYSGNLCSVEIYSILVRVMIQYQRLQGFTFGWRWILSRWSQQDTVCFWWWWLLLFLCSQAILFWLHVSHRKYWRGN